jgi:hypothetical protein
MLVPSAVEKTAVWLNVSDVFHALTCRTAFWTNCTGGTLRPATDTLKTDMKVSVSGFLSLTLIFALLEIFSRRSSAGSILRIYIHGTDLGLFLQKNSFGVSISGQLSRIV